MKFNLRILFLSVISVLLTAVIGTLLIGNRTKESWYLNLKPSFTPPNIVFPIVWTILFIMIAIAMYLSLSKKPDKKMRTKISSEPGSGVL